MLDWIGFRRQCFRTESEVLVSFQARNPPRICRLCCFDWRTCRWHTIHVSYKCTLPRICRWCCFASYTGRWWALGSWSQSCSPRPFPPSSGTDSHPTRSRTNVVRDEKPGTPARGFKGNVSFFLHHDRFVAIMAIVDAALCLEPHPRFFNFLHYSSGPSIVPVK